MTKYQKYLLMCLQEECNELAQRISKALRFGINERQSDGPSKSISKDSNKTNAERINEEYLDLISVKSLCYDEKILNKIPYQTILSHKEMKKNILKNI